MFESLLLGSVVRYLRRHRFCVIDGVECPRVLCEMCKKEKEAVTGIQRCLSVLFCHMFVRFDSIWGGLS